MLTGRGVSHELTLVGPGQAIDQRDVVIVREEQIDIKA
jgi:hypothetical protein